MHFLYVFVMPQSMNFVMRMLFQIELFFLLLAKFYTTYFKSSFLLTPNRPILFFEILTSKNRMGSSFSSLSLNLNSFTPLLLTFSNYDYLISKYFSLYSFSFYAFYIRLMVFSTPFI